MRELHGIDLCGLLRGDSARLGGLSGFLCFPGGFGFADRLFRCFPDLDLPVQFIRFLLRRGMVCPGRLISRLGVLRLFHCFLVRFAVLIEVGEAIGRDAGAQNIHQRDRSGQRILCLGRRQGLRCFHIGVLRLSQCFLRGVGLIVDLMDRIGLCFRIGCLPVGGIGYGTGISQRLLRGGQFCMRPGGIGRSRFRCCLRALICGSIGVQIRELRIVHSGVQYHIQRQRLGTDMMIFCFGQRILRLLISTLRVSQCLRSRFCGLVGLIRFLVSGMNRSGFGRGSIKDGMSLFRGLVSGCFGFCCSLFGGCFLRKDLRFLVRVLPRDSQRLRGGLLCLLCLVKGRLCLIAGVSGILRFLCQPDSFNGRDPCCTSGNKQ